MNEIKFSIYSKTTLKIFLEKICPHWTVWIKKSDACNVQSDLNVHCMQMVMMSCLAVQGLIHPKLKDDLSDLWWYYELKKVKILAGKKSNRTDKLSDLFTYFHDCFTHTQAHFPF